jgi:hypothetical protein
MHNQIGKVCCLVCIGIGTDMKRVHCCVSGNYCALWYKAIVAQQQEALGPVVS